MARTREPRAPKPSEIEQRAGAPVDPLPAAEREHRRETADRRFLERPYSERALEEAEARIRRGDIAEAVEMIGRAHPRLADFPHLYRRIHGGD